MAENNLNSSGEIDNLNRIVADTATVLSDDNSTLNIASQARLKSAESLKNQTQSIKKLKSLTSDGISDLYSFGKSLSNSSGNEGFDSLNKIIGSTAKLLGGLAGVAWPVVGDIVAGAIEGAAELATFMTGQFSKAYGNFEKLADTGVITTFQDLRESSASLGLTYSDTEKILTKHSRSLAVFGKTAMDGRSKFQNIAHATKEVSDSFRVIGVSSADFADMQLGYIERQTLISRGKNISDKQLAEESIKYMEQLDTLSKITGISKTELQQQYMDQTRDARYRVWAAGQNETIIKNTDKVMGLLRGLDPEFASGLQDFVSSGGVLTSEMTKSRAAAAALGQGGMNIEEFRQRLTSGEDPNTIYKDVVTAMSKYSEKTNNIVTLIGKNNIVTQFANAGFDSRNKKDMDITQIEKDIIAKREAELANKTSENRKLANTRQKLYDTSKTIDLLATGSDTMASIMSGMASGIEKVIEAVFKVNGDSLPEYFKIMKQQTELSKKTTKTRKELDVRIELQIALEKDLAKLNENPNAPGNAIQKQGIESNLAQIKKEITEYKKIFDQNILQQKQLEIKRREAEQSAGYLPSAGSTAGSTSAGSTSAGSTSAGSTSAGSTSSGSTSGTSSGTQSSSSFGTSGTTSQSASMLGQQTGGLNRGISIIRELISSVESVGGSYDSIFGGSTNTPLTTMTIAQVLQHQQQMINQGAKSTAAGKYQFIMGSLKAYASKLNMDINSTMFNTATQDALADVLIKEKGYDLYKSGKITSEQFLDNLSRAWAGLPSPSKGGQSFYGGDGLNKSHISVQKALEQIGQARTGGIFSGPSTGYLAMLHGDEAVIPANPGSSALEFSTSMNNNETELVNVFSMITNKVDRMISLTRNTISIQRKFAVYGLN